MIGQETAATLQLPSFLNVEQGQEYFRVFRKKKKIENSMQRTLNEVQLLCARFISAQHNSFPQSGLDGIPR